MSILRGFLYFENFIDLFSRRNNGLLKLTYSVFIYIDLPISLNFEQGKYSSYISISYLIGFGYLFKLIYSINLFIYLFVFCNIWCSFKNPLLDGSLCIWLVGLRVAIKGPFS